MSVSDDIEKALILTRQEKYVLARQLLIGHDDPEAKQLLARVNQAILEKRVVAQRNGSNRDKRTSTAKSSNKANKIMRWSALGVLLLVVSVVIMLNIESIIPPAPLTSIELTANAVPVTPLSAQIVNAEIAPQVRTCPFDDCETVLVYQGEALQLLGRVDGMYLEGSTGWYQVIRDDQILFAHEYSIYFGGPTPIVPTVHWRTEEAPVYYGNTTNSNSSSNNSNSQSRWNCSIDYDCEDFSTCSAIRDYENSCPNNESGLDGDNDGFSCEDRCR